MSSYYMILYKFVYVCGKFPSIIFRKMSNIFLLLIIIIIIIIIMYHNFINLTSTVMVELQCLISFNRWHHLLLLALTGHCSSSHSKDTT